MRKKKKNELTNAISFAPLSQIKNPGSLLKKPGDKFSMEITKTGKKVAKLHTDGVKRALVQHPGGKTVETVSYM